MSDFRFHLQKYKPGSKGTCPNCKKPRCFVRYVDEQGIIEFPNTVGRCDHENSCGYHYTPKDYFHEFIHLLGQSTAILKNSTLKGM